MKNQPRDLCPTCNKTVDFKSSCKDYFSPSVGKFWTITTCSRCNTILNYQENDINYSNLIDRHPKLLHLFLLGFGALFSPLFIWVSNSTWVGLGVVWGAVMGTYLLIVLVVGPVGAKKVD